MKKIVKAAALLTIILVSFCGCSGRSEQEEAAQKKKEDSLMEIDRNNSVSEADKMLREADSLDKLREDSIQKATKK